MTPIDIANSLEEAAAAMVPLARWISSRKFRPPLPEGTPEPLPWRNGMGPLSVSKLSVVRFLEGLLAETSIDAELKAYFVERAEEPLGLSPFDDVNQWRALRGLTSNPAFAVIESDNIIMDVEGHPISRREFYELNLPLFHSAVEEAKRSAGQLDARAISTELSHRTFANFPSWLSALRESQDPVAEFVRYGLSRIEVDSDKRSTGRDALNSAASDPTDDLATRVFFRAFGQMLREQLLYTSERAKNIVLSRETQDGVTTSGGLRGLDLQDFNWLFLHDVYPGAIKKEAALDWQKFVERLWNDSSSFWPRNLGRKSSTFMRQWGRDVLYAILGMRNPLPPPWDVSVLLELGERRRVGNAYTPEDARAATETFARQYDAGMQQEKPAKSPQVSNDAVPAFGSPPVGPRQQQV